MNIVKTVCQASLIRVNLAIFCLDQCQIEIFNSAQYQLSLVVVPRRYNSLLHEIRVMAAVELYVNATCYACVLN